MRNSYLWIFLHLHETREEAEKMIDVESLYFDARNDKGMKNCSLKPEVSSYIHSTHVRRPVLESFPTDLEMIPLQRSV